MPDDFAIALEYLYAMEGHPFLLIDERLDGHL